MTWLRVQLTAPAGDLAALEAVLAEQGAVAITLVDAENQVDLLEPAPGETPLWELLALSALFPLDADMAALRAALLSLDGIRVTDADFVGEDDWSHNNDAVEARFGERLWLRPRAARELPRDGDGDGLVAVYLEPGLAFGSGSHPTTALCLEWIAANVRTGQRLLDFGCGSGILGIAAARLQAAVVAVDHDPQAIVATLDNAAYNDVEARVAQATDAFHIETGCVPGTLVAAATDAWDTLGQKVGGAFDVVVANILAAPIMALAGTFERVTAPGGHIVLSGVLADQAIAVRQAFAATDFHTQIEMNGWVCLHGVRLAP